MDQVLGNEHTTNPPILIQSLSPELVEESSTERATPSPNALSPSPVPGDEEDTPTDSTSSFNSGRKVRQKKQEKNEPIAELMKQSLDLKEKYRQADEAKGEKREAEEKAIQARAEEQEQKLIDIMEILVKHIVKER